MLSRASDACFGLHFTEQLREAVRLLDEELHYVITTHGWPTLEMPSRECTPSWTAHASISTGAGAEMTFRIPDGLHGFFCFPSTKV